MYFFKKFKKKCTLLFRSILHINIYAYIYIHIHVYGHVKESCLSITKKKYTKKNIGIGQEARARSKSACIFTMKQQKNKRQE